MNETTQHDLGSRQVEFDLPDETPPQNVYYELSHALDCYSHWVDRIANRRSRCNADGLLRHAAKTVPYYRSANSLRGIDVLSIDDFPLVDKAEYLSARGEFLSDTCREDDLPFLVYTNGSISESLDVRFDRAGWYDFVYDMYGRFVQTVPQLMSRMTPGTLGAVCLTNAQVQRQSYVMPSLRAAVVKQLMMQRSDAEDESVLSYLRSRSIPILYGRPSAIASLVEQDRKRGDGRVNPGIVFASGENLFDDVRSLISEWFGCVVLDAYVSTEGGLIAKECLFKTGLHVEEDRVTVEVLTSNGEITDAGEGEAVLTNWMNWGQPFIRYRTADLIDLRSTKCACGHVGKTICRMWGRETAAYRTPQGMLATGALDAILHSIPMRRYVVEQTNDGTFIIKWTPNNWADHNEVLGLTTSLEGALKRNFPQLQFAVESVEKIVAPGAKVRRFISPSYLQSVVIAG